MLIILSQKVDSDSTYTDELFRTYHYPARYRNQMHKGDIFIYYQGNRFNKSQRYYFGVGKIGEVLTIDGENYYATLVDCQKFTNKVPIYLPDGGYIEQLGYDTVRKSLNPPWQSSVRPLSLQAFSYILNAVGIQFSPKPEESLDVLKEKLKNAVREYYVDRDDTAIFRIEGIASSIANSENIQISKATTASTNKKAAYNPSETFANKLMMLVEYCKSMKMTYSYKPLLILALLDKGDDKGGIPIDTAVQYFRNYYEGRRNQGLCVEKRPCIYQKMNVSDEQISENLIANPVHALAQSNYFFFYPEMNLLSISPDIWGAMDKKSKSLIKRICRQKLKDYYSDRGN